MFVGLVIILTTFFLPWYGTSVVADDHEMNANLFLDHSEMTFLGQTISQSNEDVDYLNNTFYLTIIIFIIVIFSLVSLICYFRGFGNKNLMLKISLVFGISTFILLIVTAYYFMVETVNQIQDSKSAYFSISGSQDTLQDIGFWWNTNLNGAKLSAGPGYSWYLVIAVAVIFLIALIMLFVKQKQPIVLSSNMQQQSPPLNPPAQ